MDVASRPRSRLCCVGPVSTFEFIFLYRLFTNGSVQYFRPTYSVHPSIVSAKSPVAAGCLLPFFPSGLSPAPVSPSPSTRIRAWSQRDHPSKQQPPPWILGPLVLSLCFLEQARPATSHDSCDSL
ncbi:Ran-specific GTPase-activating protein 1 [Fusarium oxysporum f. sp. albedinis]|nr:Ran-specific GTPase-activating protein 1 [Fusarium oxysporum f. sp. albedinis]